MSLNTSSSILHLTSLPKLDLTSWKPIENSTSCFRSPNELIYDPCSPLSWSSSSPTHSNHPRSMIGYFESVLLKPAHHRLISILERSDSNSRELSVQLQRNGAGKVWKNLTWISTSHSSQSDPHPSHSLSSTSTLPDSQHQINSSSLINPIHHTTDDDDDDDLKHSIESNHNLSTPKSSSKFNSDGKPIRPKLSALLSPSFPRSPPNSNPPPHHRRSSTVSILERATVREGEERRTLDFHRKSWLYGFGYEFNHLNQSRSRMITVDGITDLMRRRLEVWDSKGIKRIGSSIEPQEGSLLDEQQEDEDEENGMGLKLRKKDGMMEKDEDEMERMDEGLMEKVRMDRLNDLHDWIQKIGEMK
ncbi:hypothetical protein DFH28DRAFT_1157087 [Melampsora americana]|nr:hypothetical protein DFH28DRAFT_1157087 [Melampsora americana]